MAQSKEHNIILMRLLRLLNTMQRFAETAVTAYECGYSEDTLQQELQQATAQLSMSDNVKVIRLALDTVSLCA